LPSPKANNPHKPRNPLALLNQAIVDCQQCPRLVDHCRQVAKQKRAAYRDHDYWGKPVPNLLPAGSPRQIAKTKLLIVGLAPGAHGANRTGRMFTGDRSGDFLYRSLHAAGFCSQPESIDRDDGQVLHQCVITAAAHCAPPGNKPTTDELAQCSGYLEQTFDAMPDLRCVLNLGSIAHAAMLRLYKKRGHIDKLAACPFGHGVEHHFEHAPALLGCYHPSQQNTFTGRLTQAMLDALLEQARKIIEHDKPAKRK